MSKTDNTKTKRAPRDPNAPPTVSVAIDEPVAKVLESIKAQINASFPGQNPSNSSLVRTALLQYGASIEAKSLGAEAKSPGARSA